MDKKLKNKRKSDIKGAGNPGGRHPLKPFGLDQV